MENFKLVIGLLLFSIVCAMFLSLGYKMPESEIRYKISDFEKEKIPMKDLYIKNNMEFENYNSEIMLEKCTGTNTVLKTYDILNYSEPKASKIMEDFVYKDLEKNIDDEKELNRLQNLIKEFPVNAFEYDLNDDGINEVIGLPPRIIYYFGPLGGEIIILQKKNNEYKKIENHLIYTFEDKIVILKEKTNGYHHMQFRRKGQSEPKHLIKYDKRQKSFKFYFYECLDK